MPAIYKHQSQGHLVFAHQWFGKATDFCRDMLRPGEVLDVHFDVTLFFDYPKWGMWLLRACQDSSTQVMADSEFKKWYHLYAGTPPNYQQRAITANLPEVNRFKDWLPRWLR